MSIEHEAKDARGDQCMARIPPDENIQLPAGETVSFSTMSTLFRTMAHRPEIMHNSMQLLEAVMRTGTVEPRLKELVAVRVSQVNYCYY
jgi:alkylhydroperoxidase family enzyme